MVFLNHIPLLGATEQGCCNFNLSYTMLTIEENLCSFRIAD